MHSNVGKDRTTKEEQDSHVWWIQARVEEVSAEELQRRLADPVFVAAMRYLQGADLFGPGPARDPRQSAGQVAGAPLTSPVSRLSRVSHRQVKRSPWPFIVADSGSVVDPVHPSTPINRRARINHLIRHGNPTKGTIS